MKFLFLIPALLLSLHTNAQIKNIFQKELDRVKLNPDDIIDPSYGIQRYNKYAPSLGGDSVRICQGYSCQGFVEDFYTNGQLAHKGYYTNGQANFFKNYYPDGTPERDFKAIDAFKGKMTTWYPDSSLRTNGTYREGSTTSYEEYFENGKLFYMEEYDKKQQYFIQNRTYYDNGLMQSSLLLINPKKLEFEKKEFHETGNIKEVGKLFFSKSAMDYIKVGDWDVYDEGGRKIKVISFENGIPVNEKDL